MKVPKEKHFAVVYDVDASDPEYPVTHQVYLPFESQDALEDWLETKGCKIPHQVLFCSPQVKSRQVRYDFKDA